MSKLYYQRYLQLDLPKKQSTFLWGARKTGKSTYLKKYFPNSVYYDLLKSDLYLRFSKAPYLFREEVLSLTDQQISTPIIVDEVQKIPSLLDEIHWLIENTNAQFILCGSSARKLRQSGVNLLGGRAWSYNFYPLIYPEITDFNLLKVFNYGTIPSHYMATNINKTLKAYVEDYLTQEIKFEGIVRNIPAFARFLDSIVYSNAEMVNYNNIARECGIDAKTVKEYYQILIDTLLGYYIFPFRKRIKRNIILSTPKFYLFDVGIANFLAKREINALQEQLAGKSLEQFILLELIAYRNLNGLEFAITYWRTKTGLEVDFVLGHATTAKVAIEVKITNKIKKQDLKGLFAFANEHKVAFLYAIALEPRARKIVTEGVEVLVLPVTSFLQQLWNKEIIS